jgi:SAM-dependent methyltransferase
VKSYDRGLAGRGLLQSPEEWAVRTRVLAESLSQLAEEYLPSNAAHGLDVGCQTGDLTDYLNAHTQLTWEGIDPALAGPEKSANGALLYSAAADDIPYPDGYFDCLLLANVFEHIPPELRRSSFIEMHRVLRPGSIVVGQLPNPYFPIESHSRLPFMGWLPLSLQKQYWRLAPVPWEHDFFTVTASRHLRTEAQQAGLEVLHIRNFNYPLEALPKAARLLAIAAKRPMRRFPWAWQFVLKRPGP